MQFTLIKSDDPTEKQIVARFYDTYLATELTIAFRREFMQFGAGGANFMPIVTHPEKRVVLKDGEFARTVATHPDPKKTHLTDLILMRGTPYGVIVLYGRANQYTLHKKTGVAEGPLPQLHTTQRFVAAAMRFFKRMGMPVRLGDRDIKQWIFSDTFAADLAEQAAIDRKAEADQSLRHYNETGKSKVFENTLLGDGLPKRIRQQHPVKKDLGKPASANDVKGAKPKASNTRRPVSHENKHPLDIVPTRANGFKGVRYADQTAAQKAAGQAAQAKMKGQLVGGQPA